MFTLRISLARIAQTMPHGIEQMIPGSAGQTGLGIAQLAALASDVPRGWNRLAEIIRDEIVTLQESHTPPV